MWTLWQGCYANVWRVALKLRRADGLGSQGHRRTADGHFMHGWRTRDELKWSNEELSHFTKGTVRTFHISTWNTGCFQVIEPGTSRGTSPGAELWDPHIEEAAVALVRVHSSFITLLHLQPIMPPVYEHGSLAIIGGELEEEWESITVKIKAKTEQSSL